MSSESGQVLLFVLIDVVCLVVDQQHRASEMRSFPFHSILPFHLFLFHSFLDPGDPATEVIPSNHSWPLFLFKSLRYSFPPECSSPFRPRFSTILRILDPTDEPHSTCHLQVVLECLH